MAKEMPAMKRALCAWMIIVAEFPSWFKADSERKAELCRLCNLESTEDFELGWRDMVNKFELARKGEPRKKYKKPRPKVRVGLPKKICQYFDVRIGREENEVIVVLGSRGDSFCLALRFLNSNWVQKPVSTHFQEKTWRKASIFFFFFKSFFQALIRLANLVMQGKHNQGQQQELK
ncbi:hypothetical protein NC651_011936 [Populus alba x Populus x berolinensis]|nr:hypothetical protein NC651_011936 [Populus alba x Populus x berolinensis]